MQKQNAVARVVSIIQKFNISTGDIESYNAAGKRVKLDTTTIKRLEYKLNSVGAVVLEKCRTGKRGFMFVCPERYTIVPIKRNKKKVVADS